MAGLGRKIDLCIEKGIAGDADGATASPVEKVQYHLAEYGGDLLVEGVGMNAKAYALITSRLPEETRRRLFGWRNLEMLPLGKGEKMVPHPLDGVIVLPFAQVVVGGAA